MLDRQIRIAPNQRIGLDLTGEERRLLVDLNWLGPDLEDRLRSTLAGERNVMFTLDELGLLAGDVAAGANHTGDTSLQNRLDTIYSRIGGKISDLLADHIVDDL